MEEARGLSQCAVNKKAVGIAWNSCISLKSAAPLGTFSPGCVYTHFWQVDFEPPCLIRVVEIGVRINGRSSIPLPSSSITS